MTRRRLFAAGFAVVACLAVRSSTGLGAATDIPDRLTDREFWTLTEGLSEPSGSFRSDNFLSNERGYQSVIPDLISRLSPGGVYLGVGPEQNFPYIVALKSKMAFIIDIRRGNLHEQLLYKALFEMSSDRADFLSRLFSRQRPGGLSRTSTVEELFTAYDAVQPSEELYAENLRTVIDWLKNRHQFPLGEDDVNGVEYVYHRAFFLGGPDLNYAVGRGAGFGGSAPTFEELMLAQDGNGQNRGFLASEDNFAFLKTLETNNLLVPVVGNFGGPKAIRAVGRYVKDHGGTVSRSTCRMSSSTLIQDDIWDKFCANVATLPLDETSTFIFSGRGSPNGSRALFGRGRGLQTAMRPILHDVTSCAIAQ